MTLTPDQRLRATKLALEDCWERGCTCGMKAETAILGEESSRVKVGVEHLQGCPLWTARDLDNLPDDTPPDSLSRVEL